MSACNIALIPGPWDFINLFLSYTLIYAEAKKSEYVLLFQTQRIVDVLKTIHGVQAPQMG